MQNPLRKAKEKATCAAMAPVRKIENLLTGLTILVIVLFIAVIARGA